MNRIKWYKIKEEKSYDKYIGMLRKKEAFLITKLKSENIYNLVSNIVEISIQVISLKEAKQKAEDIIQEFLDSTVVKYCYKR